MTPNQAVKYAADNGAKMLDLRFMDFPGLWQHITVPISEFNEEVFEDGYGFDGSSIRGFQPAEGFDIVHASRFECENCLREIQTFHFREFLSGTRALVIGCP